ncbi:MAG: hypothetical protein QG564_705 [Campylobacterota bacterium]|nr:hypothetical protein [Campylobacterota bacterium]
MKSISFRIFGLLLLADSAVIFISLIFFDLKILYSTQIGFISSALVVIASFLSYQRMVAARIEKEIIMIDDSKDVVDRVEDPYDLYGEEAAAQEEQSLNKTIKEEKAKLKENRRSLFEVLKDTKAALSVYRLGAYFLLVLGFLYLQRHELLHIPAYLFALSLPPVVIIVMLLRDKANHTEDSIQ